MMEMENPWEEIPTTDPSAKLYVAPVGTPLPGRVTVGQIEQHDLSCAEIAEEARIRAEVSYGRRESWRARRKKNSLQLLVTSPLMIFGIVMLIDQLLRVTPTPYKIILGILAVLPFLVFLIERIDD